MVSCFENCISLTDTSGLTICTDASDGTDMTDCFKGCSELTNIPSEMLDENGAIKMGYVTDMTSCFEGCTGLSGKTFYFNDGPTVASKWTDAFKGLTGVTVQIWNNCSLKAAIEAGSPNVTVEFRRDPPPTCE